MTCYRQSKTENKANSILFDTIYDKIAEQNEFKADELYSYFESENFIEDFGDYKKLYNDESFLNRIDENGEPKLFYNETAKKYYYINNNGEQIFFPLVDRGLRSIFDYKQIEAITSQLAYSYFTSNTKFDFNNIDFEKETELLPNLKDFLQKKLESKANDLLVSEEIKDMFNGMSIQSSLKYIDNWVELVDNFYRQIGLKRNDELDDTESIEEIEQDTKDPAYNKNSFERDTKEAVSTNIKLRLSLLQDKSNIDTIWNEPFFIKFDDVYSTLLIKLANQVPIEVNGEIEDIFELYKDQITKLSSKKPYLNDLLNYLNDKNFSENSKNEFTQAFNLHKNSFLVSQIKKDVAKRLVENPNTSILEKLGETNTKKITIDVFSHEVIPVSDSGDKASRVLSQWGVNFKNIFLNENNTLKLDSLNKFKELKEILTKLKENFKNPSEKEFENTSNSYLEILRSLGVEPTKQGFHHFLENQGENEFDFNAQVTSLISYITNTIKAINEASKEQKGVEAKFKNPLETQSIFKQLASAEAFFSGEGSNASVRTGGKSKWLFSYPSYISKVILSWKKNSDILKSKYESSAYTKGSALIRWLLAVDENVIDKDPIIKSRLDSFDIGVFNNLQEQLTQNQRDNNKKRESESASEISFVDYFMDHVNKTLSNNYRRTTTPADKTTDLQIKTGYFVNTFGGFKNGKILVNKKVLNIFTRYFTSEFNRMIEAANEIEVFQNDLSQLKVHYHYKKGSTKVLGNAFKSQYFPELSSDSTSTNPLVIQLRKLLYKDGFPRDFKVDLMNNPMGRIEDETFNILPLLQEYISEELTKGITETGNQFRRHELIKYDSEGKTVNNLIDTKVFDSYKNNVSALVSDFYINSLIQNIEYSKMFSGDVAFYKDMIDYKKRIPATYTDGLQLRLKPGEENFTVASINSIEIATPFYDEMVKSFGKEIAKPYKEINSADAQAWITPQRWKFLINRLGKWTETHDSLYDKMMLKDSEPLTEKELKIAAQPLKGVYFDINGKTPTYLKYSQAVLTPRLVGNNTGLKRILDSMNKNNIDELITLDGFKVGSPTPTTIHNEDGTVSEDIKFNTIQIKNSGWKLQQDLPTKTFKDTEVGSQIQKNIFGGLKFNKEVKFDFNDQEVTGQDIINEITNVTKALSNYGWKSLQKEFGIDNNFKIKNVRGFYNSLISELERRGGSKNVIEALKKEIVLYGIPQAGTKVINVFSSIINKRLVKITTNGGSFIQMSNFGLSKSEAEDKGVIWSPNALSTTHEPQFLTKKTNYVAESYKGFWNRNEISKNTDKIYLFGDNTDDRVNTKYIPITTQAVIRGLENSIGIDTKKNRSVSKDSYLTDEDFDWFKKHVDEQINLAKNSGKIIVIPEDGIGTGKAMLKEKAPKLFEYLQNELNNLKNNKEYILSKNGKKIIRPGGILLSGSFIAKYIPDYRKYSSEELFNEIIDKKISENIIGYRIPNQGLASNDAYNIVGILPEENGDTIVAYTGITKKTGSDFDVDKQYLMIPYYKKIDDKLVYVDDTEDSKEGLSNKLIKLYKSVLTHPDVIKDVLVPIDIEFIKDDIIDLYPENKGGTLTSFNSYNDIQLLYDFRGGKAGVGQEANAVVDINRLGKLSLNKTYIGWGHKEDKQTVFDNEYSVELSKEDLQYYQKDLSLENIDSIKKVKIADSLTAILNAFVDIAKDPYITRGNWTTSTTNVGNMMLRAGMHPLYVTAFMAQPIIKQYIDFQADRESIIAKDSGDIDFKFRLSIAKNMLKDQNVTIGDKTKSLESIFDFFVTPKKLSKVNNIVSKIIDENAVLNFFKINAKDEVMFNIASNVVEDIVKTYNEIFKGEGAEVTKASLEQLRNQIKNKPSGQFQIAVYDKFKELQGLSKNLRENVDLSKADTNGMGKNINTLFRLRNLKSWIKQKERSNKEGVLNGIETKFDNTVLSAYYNQLIQVIDLVDANPNLFPQGQLNVQDMFNEISGNLYGTPAFDEELITDLESEYYTYTMSNFFNLSAEENKRILQKTPKEFEKFRKANRNKYLIVDELQIKEGESVTNINVKSVLPKFLGLNNRKKSIDFETRFTDSWRDLMIDNPKFAEDLIKYSFITSGFKMNQSQFFTYIPNEYFVQNNINQFINDFPQERQEDFIDKFYKNNSTNRKYVKSINFEDIIPIETDVNNQAVYNNGFIMNKSGDSKYYLSLKGLLFKLEGYDESNRGIYTRQLPLGAKVGDNTISEYGIQFTDKFLNDRKDIKINNNVINELKDRVVYHRESIKIEDDVNEEEVYIEKDDIETLWDEYKDKILNKYPNETIEQLEMLEQDMGIEKLREYLKKCY